MREIKYRQRVTTVDGNTFWHFWGVLTPDNFVSPISNVMNKSAESQQYTGLKDKNGKEIYEGDIVMRNTYTVESGIPGMSGPYVIVWDAEKAGFEYKTNGYKSGLFHKVHEVIGNIYENSDLIENV